MHIYFFVFGEKMASNKSDYVFFGELEQVVLLALARLQDRAYGMAIHRDIEERTGRDVAIGSVYRALDRLERKGYVSSHLGEPTPERGGRAKRFYAIESPGLSALHKSREMFARLWEGLRIDPEVAG